MLVMLLYHMVFCESRGRPCKIILGGRNELRRYATERCSSPSGQNLWISRHFCQSVCVCVLPSGKHTKSYGKSPFLMGKLTISMAIFNSKLLVYQRVVKKCHSPCTWTSQPQTMCLFQCEKSHECTMSLSLFRKPGTWEKIKLSIPETWRQKLLRSQISLTSLFWGFHSHVAIPIAGWFISIYFMENPTKILWKCHGFWGSPILGNPHM